MTFELPEEGDRIRVNWNIHVDKWQDATVMPHEMYQRWHGQKGGFAFRLDDYDYRLEDYPTNTHSWTPGMRSLTWEIISKAQVPYDPTQQGDTDDDI